MRRHTLCPRRSRNLVITVNAITVNAITVNDSMPSQSMPSLTVVGPVRFTGDFQQLLLLARRSGPTAPVCIADVSSSNRLS